MQHVPTLITDLAIILTYAGIFTILFKKLKQPLVLGYIVAGFLTTPFISFTPSVADSANVKTWADLGVIFLLFSLGLEFSFKKILKVGSSVIVATSTIILFMMLAGMLVGALFGWSRMDCIFLGGMIAMSSTTIIYKAFDDMGLRQKKFANTVLGILILEDVLAIVLLVMLSTLAVSNNVEGTEMVLSLGKLLFFLVLCFVVGIYLIPTFFRLVRGFMSNEILLVVAISLCFVMVYLASYAGFSPSFGAFIMGSILAETIEGEKIEHLVAPVKDFCGAVFFVSVGMMVDPLLIQQYWLPILVIVLTVVFGQAFFGTVGVLLSGQPLKTALQCGLSLTQIGEFSFIIATLGTTLGVIDSFLYPVVVAVSVITTFLTPYSIRLALPFYGWVERKVPAHWLHWIDHFANREAPLTGTDEKQERDRAWKQLIVSVVRIVLIYSIVVIALMAVCMQFFVPILRGQLGPIVGNILGALLTVVVCSPFLRAIVVKKNHSREFKFLRAWGDTSRLPLFLLLLSKYLVALGFVFFIVSSLCGPSVILSLLIALLLVAAMVYSRSLKKRSILIERKFMHNFRQKEYYDLSSSGQKKPEYAGNLLARDLHLTDVVLPTDSSWAGKTLMELDLGKRFGVHVSSILRDHRHINIPGGRTRIFPQDELQVIGTDESIAALCAELKASVEEGVAESGGQLSAGNNMVLRSLALTPHSLICGKTIRDCGVREHFRCLIVGVERGENFMPDFGTDLKLQEGDVVWLVGEAADLRRLFAAKV